jgi:hypothetical protein
MRIIFDRSAFHGPRYQRVRESGIEALCRGNMVTVLHAGVFLTETLALYGHPGRREELRDQMEFLKNICNGGIFRDSVDIWEDELIRDYSVSTPCLLSDDEEHLVWRRAMQGIQQPSWADWHKTAGDRSVHSKKKTAQREIYSSIRKGLAEKIKRECRGIPLRSYTYEQHRIESMDAMGRAVIDSQFGLTPATSALIQNRWSYHRERYPYFSSFVEGLTYAGYYAGIEQNVSLDDNSQADFELLTFLNHADVVVSSDTRFFRYAFDAIWRPLGKHLVLPEELRDFLAVHTPPDSLD